MDIYLFLVAIIMIWSILVFLLVIHEYGHLIEMYRQSVKADYVQIGFLRLFSISIDGLRWDIGAIPLIGGVHSAHYAKSSPSVRAKVAFAGPLCSLVAAVVFYLYSLIVPSWVLDIAIKGSLVFVLTNLIPVPPMDGYYIVRPLLSKAGLNPSEQSERYLAVLGIFLAIGIALIV